VVRAVGGFEVGQNARMLHHAQEKSQIARRAAQLTAGTRVMFVGVGSTVEQFARMLVPRDDLVVVTTSLAVASLLGTRRVRVIVAGGLVRQDELSCVGASAVEGVQKYNTDVAVIGAAGISAHRGVTDLDDREAEVTRAALEHTERIVVVADGSKFGDVAMSTVVPIQRVAVIVTDPGADPAEVERIEREGVEVIIVAPESPAHPAPIDGGRNGSSTPGEIG
jgi:DeoR/GlpR family transcriptional regulator of sugar metabolism